MNRARYERATEIFQQALDQDPDARGEYVDRACDGDEALLTIVRKLLRSDSDSSFLERPAALPSEQAGEQATRSHELRSIGDYRVIRVIASGSMGIVFLAEQASPKRHVAIKLLTLDDAAKSSLLAEASMLGRLQHPGVARIYEAGTAQAEYEDGTSASGA